MTFQRLEHVWFKCPPGCTRPSCNFCQGGLSLCIVCAAGEGELLSSCPGYGLNEDARTACYTGNVIDFEHFREIWLCDKGLFYRELKRRKG